jgi:hypothetical protein
VRIGPYQLKNNLIVAPMAGVTDRPFRQLCKLMGAGMAVSEMVASNSLLWGSAKTLRRANHEGEVDPISVQIAGADPQMLADAARYNVDQGAQIIDINMGCPAKKVCNKWAGSALMQDEALAISIARAVVAAMPDGRYSAESRLDSDGRRLDVPLRVKVTVEIKGSDFTIDYSEMNEQVPGPLISGYSGGLSAARVAFKILTMPRAPVNEGCFRALKLISPVGTMLNARPPAALGWLGEVHAVDAVREGSRQAGPGLASG